MAKEIINQSTLAKEIARDSRFSYFEVEDVIGALILAITTNIKNDRRVRINGFGTFETRHRAAREGVNPQNPTERIQIPAVDVVKFTAASRLKEQVKQ